MPPMLVTLSVRRAEVDAGLGNPAAAVFFLKIAKQHTLKAVKETLAEVLGLEAGVQLPIMLNGKTLELESTTTSVRGARCARFIQARSRFALRLRRALRRALAPPILAPPQVGLQTGSVLEAALDDDSFEKCMRSEHKGLLVDLDDFKLSNAMGGMLS